VFRLVFTPEAVRNLDALKADRGLAKRLKAVKKALGVLQTNPRHPGLNTHEFHSVSGPTGEKVFEAYAENQTAPAYRIFWFYGPGKDVITVVAITPHP
jgi:hypothetical protein